MLTPSRTSALLGKSVVKEHAAFLAEPPLILVIRREGFRGQ
jgi:hypothetical protein